MKLVAFDVETRGIAEGYGLQPFRALTGEAWVTMCAMATDKGVGGYRKPTREQLKAWLDVCIEKGLTITTWNGPFDAAWLIAMGLREEVYKAKWLDAMLLWKHITMAPEWLAIAIKSYGLKAAVKHFYPLEAGYEDDIDFETDDPIKLDELFAYNKKDAWFTLALTEHFIGLMPPEMLRNALIEAACIPMVAESLITGLLIDRDAAVTLERKLTDDAHVAMVTLKLTTYDDVSSDTIASPKKLANLLYKTWCLTPPKKTPKGADSTDRDALSTLSLVDPRAALLNAHREAKNNCTKFATGAINSVDYNGDGYVRPSPRVYGTYTGRMTYNAHILKGLNQKPTGIPIHQWKRDFWFRSLVKAPPGYTVLEFDFSGQEYRWMAVMSGDPTMLSMCAPGEDAHAYMAAKVHLKDYRKFMQDYSAGLPGLKDERQLGKVSNLSLQYRTSANTLIRVARVQYGLTLSEPQARATHATYRTTYPRVQKYWAKQIDFAKSQGYALTIAGRRINLGLPSTWWYRDRQMMKQDLTWKAESTAINFPIQGSGADQKYLALAVMKNYMPRVNGKFYFELHDGLFFIVPDEHVERALVEGKYLLSNLPYKKAWDVTLPIQFPVDAKSGKSWGQLKEFKG